MNAPTIAEIGEALFGPQWVSPLARELGKDLRTVQRWNAGTFKPDPASMRRLAEMLRARHARNAEILSRADTFLSIAC